MSAPEENHDYRLTLFKDPVHGYISVPKDLCRRFIDTSIFQRLHNIEQTSMRPLFPAARHDRFIHSLGVYHLGRQVYSALEWNTKDTSLKHILSDEKLKDTFLIACLMHDCGHAPFSHTFEGFYNYSDASKPKRAYQRMHEVLNHDDFKVGEAFDPAPHEALSAVILFQHFKDDAATHGWNPVLAARMITGCSYPNPVSDHEHVYNALIGLLNGDAIDCDKLDYIVRDTWSSGVKNTAVDIERLLGSYTLFRDKTRIRVCHHKSALSVIQSVIDARNYLYEWVYTHHTVLYYSELLRRSLKKLAKHYASAEDADIFWNTVFSDQAFATPQTLKDFHIFMPTDGDLLYLLKAKAAELGIREMNEVHARKPSRVALWKTYAEFRLHFEAAPFHKDNRCKSIAKRVPQVLSTQLGCAVEDVLVAEAVSKHYTISDGDIWVLVGGQPVTYTHIYGGAARHEPQRFFYVFVPARFGDQRQALIETIAGLQR